MLDEVLRNVLGTPSGQRPDDDIRSGYHAWMFAVIKVTGMSIESLLMVNWSQIDDQISVYSTNFT